MLEIKVVTDKTCATGYLIEKGYDIDLKPYLVMCATETEKVCGVGAVSMESDAAVIEYIICDDDLDYAMGKALLNTLDLGGISDVVIKNEKLFTLAKRLRFKCDESSNIYTLSLNGYFTAHCQ